MREGGWRAAGGREDEEGVEMSCGLLGFLIWAVGCSWIKWCYRIFFVPHVLTP